MAENFVVVFMGDVTDRRNMLRIHRRALRDSTDVTDRRNILRIHRRALRDSTDPFAIPEERFMELFRFNKEGAVHLLNELSPHMKNGIRRTYIPKAIRMCAALYYYATGSVLRDCGQDFICPVSKTMMCRIVREITYIIQDKLMKKYINFPTTEEKQNQIKRRFFEATGFPGVIGTLDCTHVKIKKPEMEVEDCYFNKKGFHSKNVQLICTFDLEIINCLARFGGGCHDAFIWNSSRAREFLKGQYERNNQAEVWVLGDSGYPLEPWLLTPISNPSITMERKYNEAHILTRNCVERLNGVLKKVFGCLSGVRCIMMNPALSGAIINACCTLHNIRRNYNLPLPSDDNGSVEGTEIHELVVQQSSYLQQGSTIRDRIIRNYFFS